MKENGKILYVLVICGCTVEQSEAFRTLILPSPDEIKHTFVYDNSSIVQTTGYEVAAYVHDTQNHGLSKAYNEASRFAAAHGYTWLLLLDQDTMFPADALSFYKSAANTVKTDMIVPRHKIDNGLYLSPTPYSMKTSKLQRQAPTGLVSFRTCCPINSGMLVTVSSFIKAGGYEESVWLDMSDICFIEKYRRYYDSYYVMPEVTCIQSFSGLETQPEKIFRRYCIYLECARNFPRRHLRDSLALLITTLRPTLSRTLREKTLKYVKAYFHIYISGKRYNFYECRN